jgi:CspA family cold shock protein
VAMGIVKWFNQTKGFGFIRPDDGAPDVFVHVNAVKKAGYPALAEGVRVSYELMPARKGKVSAENLRIG